jgi:hypothetical protein
MVSSVKPEDQFTRWRTEYESDIIVSVASLAGERLFYGGDNSSGVSGDLESATAIATYMEGYWGMGTSITSQGVTQQMLGVLGGGPPRGEGEPRPGGGGGGGGARIGAQIEAKLREMFERAERLLQQNRLMVLALAHALETHKTISGDDVAAIMENRKGPLVDGRVYHTPYFAQVAEHYHRLAVVAHKNHARVEVPLPTLPPIPEFALVGAGWGGNGHHGNGNGHLWAPPPTVNSLPPPPPRP